MSDDAPEDEAAPAEAPPPRRRKRRPARAEEGTPAETVATEGTEGDAPDAPSPRPDVPAFARDFPRDPELDALVAAFEAGDYARVRREAPALARETSRDDVRAAARALRRRLDPDPLAVYLLAGAAVLLVFLAGWYGVHAHAP